MAGKSNFKNTIRTENTTSKDFNYMLGDVNLKFSLRTDIKQQLKDFKECLVRAVEDVDNELKKQDGKN